MADLGTPTKFTTTWVIGLLAAVLIGWDVYAAMSATVPTVSAVSLRVAMQHPVLPFLAGVIAGHLFWPQQVKT